MKNKENDMMDFTQGSILKKLLRFMVPILGALILQAAYGAVDLLVVDGSDPLRDCPESLPVVRC